MQTLSTRHLLLHQLRILGSALLDLLVHLCLLLDLQLTAHGQQLVEQLTVKRVLLIPTVTKVPCPVPLVPLALPLSPPLLAVVLLHQLAPVLMMTRPSISLDLNLKVFLHLQVSSTRLD
jgi:hypothetical protein